MHKQAVLGVVALLAVYVLGAMSDRHAIFPWPQIIALRQMLPRADPLAESRYAFDAAGRLATDETKVPVACPAQTDRTAVLLVLGQSNAANHGGQRYRSDYGARVVNFYEGRCFIAASPLLGSTDTRGEYWTLLANLLVASGKVDAVVLAPLAFSGSEVERWAEGGDINALLVDTVGRLAAAHYAVTDILWDQGEVDYVKGTTTDAYRQRFLSMLATLRAQKVAAPIYVAVASKCLEPTNNGFKVDAPDNPVVRAQMALPQSGGGIRPGVNTDTTLGDFDRYDDCHIAGSGAEKVARAWAGLLLGR